MSYGMPAVKLHGIVVYYAYWEKHMAIYPMPSALKEFASQTSALVTSKSTIQFPHGSKLPKKLIKDIVKFRVAENKMKAELHPILNHDEDQVLFVSLGPEDSAHGLRIEAMGLPYLVRSRVTIV